MNTTHFKRYRMQINLRHRLMEPPPLPPGFQIWPWRNSLLDLHSAAKWASFSQEMDAVVFSCLADANGCRQLMNDIVNRSNFAPQATWLIVQQTRREDKPVACGTVQGIFDAALVGSIQNVGVVPEFRGNGLGSILLHRALLGFQHADQQFATLEVTARNTAAIRLYQRVGFDIARTVYRSVDFAFE